MIDVDSVTKRYGPVTALAGVSLRVPRGQVCGFLGPNGAGKSTLLKILTCFLPATSGTASIAGHRVDEAPMEVKRRIGYLPEHAPLYLDMVVKDYLDHVAQIRRLGGRKARLVAAAKAAERCELLDVAGRRISELSKGFRQRVGLAQALLHDPEVLILDEPTSGLDPIQNRRVRDVIRNLAADRTVIFSTHILSEVEAVCDRAIVIDRGRLVADGPVDELRRRQGDRVLLELALHEGTTEAALLEALRAAVRENASLEKLPGQGGPKSRISVALSLAAGAPSDLLDGALRTAQARSAVLDVRRERQSLEEVFFGLTQPERAEG